jgi:hypothetical protein
MRQIACLILPAICIAAAACSSSNHETGSTSTVLPVAGAALDGLLLSSVEVSAAMGATAMTVAGTYDKVDDHSAVVSDRNCLVMYGPGEPSVYDGSGASDTRAQFLKDVADSSQAKHAAFQTVVSFSSADQAAAFFIASSKRWSACSNLRYTVTLPQLTAVWDVGPLSNTDGILSATETRQGGQGWACQRALTVRNDVAIDITACSDNPANAAVNIAHKIAANVG